MLTFVAARTTAERIEGNTTKMRGRKMSLAHGSCAEYVIIVLSFDFLAFVRWQKSSDDNNLFI